MVLQPLSTERTKNKVEIFKMLTPDIPRIKLGYFSSNDFFPARAWHNPIFAASGGKNSFEVA